MASMKSRLFVTLGVGLLVSSFASATMAETPIPSINSTDLGQGPYSYMQMLLQKTIVRLNILTLEVRVDKPTQTRLAGLVRGNTYSDVLAQQLANVAIEAQRSVSQMRFKRDIGLDRWIGVLRDNLVLARKAGVITADLEKKVSQALPTWFAPIQSRGYKKGDRVIYSVSPDSLRTVVVSEGGQVLVDRVDREQGGQRVVMACYFTYGSEFRELLLRSLFSKTQ